MNSFNLFAQLKKVDEEKRLVYGRAVQEVVDKSNEVFDYEASKPHFQKWSAEIAADTGGKSFGNVRAMHGKVSAGVLKTIDFNDAEKAIDVCAHINDDQEWKKVLGGNYRGFSIGGSYVGEKKAEKMAGQDVKRYTAKPSEISIVDSPCIPSAKFFEIQRADGSLAKAEFMPNTGDESDTSMMSDQEKKDFAAADDKGKQAMRDKMKSRKVYEVVGEDGKALLKTLTVDEAAVGNALTIEKVEYEVAKIDGDKLVVKRAPKEEPLEITGTDEEVLELGKLMNENKLNMTSVLGVLKYALPLLKGGLTANMLAEPAVPVAPTPEQSMAKALELAKADGIDGPTLVKDEAKSKDYVEKAITALTTPIPLMKEMNGVGSLTFAVHALTSLLSKATDPRLPHAVSTVINVLKQVTADEAAVIVEKTKDGYVAKLVAQLSELAKVDDFDSALELVKIGARNSKTDKQRIDTVHKIAVELGAECGAAKLDKVVEGDLTKLVDAAVEKVSKVYEDRIKKLEAQPAPSKARLRIVTKGAALNEDEDDSEVSPVLKNDGKVDEIATSIKKVHQSGGRPLFSRS